MLQKFLFKDTGNITTVRFSLAALFVQKSPREKSEVIFQVFLNNEL